MNATRHIRKRIAGNIHGYLYRKLNICTVYMVTAKEDQTWNTTIYECISKDICTTFENEPTMTVGDFNCHILELDGRESGAAGLRKLVKKHDLRIVNLEPECEGIATWSRRNQ